MHALLDQEAPGLAARLQSLSPEVRRRVVAAASLVVARHSSELSLPARRLLETLEEARFLTPADAVTAGTLAEAADARYFELQDAGGHEDQAMRSFSEARLMAAMASLFGDTAPERACEAAYELCKVCDDPAVAIHAIEAELRDLPA